MQKSRLTRRDLLHSAAAAFAAPYIIPSTALGDRTTLPPSERVTTAHFGAGSRGRVLLREAMHCKATQPIAVFDPYDDRLEQGARTIGTETAKKRFSSDITNVLRDVDAVVIATPDHWHVSLAAVAAKAGTHVYLETPLGLSAELDLIALGLFRRAGVVLQYGTQQRSLPHCRLGCELVRNGRIGKIQRIEVTAPDGGAGGRQEAGSPPASFDFDLWLGPCRKRSDGIPYYSSDRCNPPGVYWIYDYSIGALAGNGAHPLDIMIWACDSDQSGPMTVEGRGEVPQGLYNTVIHWDVTARMGDGTVMTFKPGPAATKFIGTEGWIEVRADGLDAEPKSLLPSDLDPVNNGSSATAAHLLDFAEAVKAGRQPISPLVDAVRSDIISHLCDISIRLGRKVTWDPNRSQIVGDPEAARMLHCDQRNFYTLERFGIR